MESLELPSLEISDEEEEKKETFEDQPLDPQSEEIISSSSYPAAQPPQHVDTLVS